MGSKKPILKLDWATHKAAKYAVENWHYSKVLPVPPLFKIGVWEDSCFKGVLIFSRGANNNLLKPFCLKQTEGCELTRVALHDHFHEVSRILSLAFKLYIRNHLSMRLVVSFADPEENHIGSIYKAGGWIYTGQQPSTTEYISPDGRQWHGRMVSKDGKIKVHGQYRKCWRRDQCSPVVKQGKHRYLMPLDSEMRRQIMPLSKQYPKRPSSIVSDATGSQLVEGGATPTDGL